MRPTAARVLALALALSTSCRGGGAAAPDSPTLPAAVEPAPDLSRPVSSITVTGLATERAAAGRRLIASALGVPRDAAQIRRDVRALWNLGGIADVVVRARAAEGGVALVFEVTERPRIGEVELVGAVAGVRSFDPRVAFGAERGQVFDPVALGRGRAALAQAYRDHGFAFAEVSWTTRPGEGGALDVVLKVVEGAPVTIGAIGFRGNHKVAAAALSEAFGKAGAAPGGAYVRDLIEGGLLHLSALFYDRGHIQAEVGPVEEVFDADHKVVSLVVPVVEGPIFRVGQLAVRGALAAEEKAYLARLGVKKGEVFSRGKLVEGIARMSALHVEQGKPQPRIDPITDISQDTKVVNLTFEVLAD